MTIKFAFAGLRHAHIVSLYRNVVSHPACSIVAICEENEDARQHAAKEWQIIADFHDFSTMLHNVDFDVLAIGDYYSRRGSMIVDALNAGKHVIADKPLCTSIDELTKIEQLVVKSELKVGCMLDLRDHPNVVAARQLIQSGRIGDIQSISFGGQHPLLLASRPHWYFECGKHGGTINDIAIHGLDLVEWLTGHSIDQMLAARTWNAWALEYPHFCDAAQFMVKLDNGCGILGDVSYFSPDSHGYKLPFYWRFTLWGKQGVIEFNYNEPGIKVALNGVTSVTVLSGMDPTRNYFDDFLDDLQGIRSELNTARVLSVARKALMLQLMAGRK